MSSTRTAQPGSPLRQERWASSPEFDFALKANLVAKRCTVLECPEQREIIWFLQYVCGRMRGMDKVAADIVSKFSDQIGTKEMCEGSISAGAVYGPEKASLFRKHFPRRPEAKLLLKGEFSEDEENTLQLAGCGNLEVHAWAIKESVKIRALSATRPDSISGKVFIDLCTAAARMELAEHLTQLCLNPSTEPKVAPWYFHNLYTTLGNYKAEWQARHGKGVITEVGQKVSEAIQFARETRMLALLTGRIGLGATFSAKQFCERFPERARYMQVPSANDRKTFYMALAQALGVACNLGVKAQEIQKRCEDVLQSSDIALVLDDADLLLPNTNLRDSACERIQWILSALLPFDVPVVMIGSPYFFKKLDLFHDKGGWNTDELRGRIGLCEELPDLSPKSLKSVAEVMLPGAEEKLVLALVGAAQTSGRYLTTMETVARAAIFEARQAGRVSPNREDFKNANSRWVIPSLENISKAAASSQRTKRERLAPVPRESIAPQEVENFGVTERRSVTPETDSGSRIPAPEFVAE